MEQDCWAAQDSWGLPAGELASTALALNEFAGRLVDSMQGQLLTARRCREQDPRSA